MNPMAREKRSDAVETINRHVGCRLAELRTARGLARGELATETRLSARALGRIEAGARELEAASLYELADALGVEMSAFFEGLAPQTVPQPAGLPTAEQVSEIEALLDAFLTIEDPEQRLRIVQLLKACATSGMY